MNVLHLSPELYHKLAERKSSVIQNAVIFGGKKRKEYGIK